MKQKTNTFETNNPATKARKEWMGVLARSNVATLERAWDNLKSMPEYRFLRSPETGMVMVRGRAGGKGQRFNLGEMTMTRCTVRLENGAKRVGHGYVAGRNPRHAELAALFDGLLQDPELNLGLIDKVILPLREAQHEKKRKENAKTAATRVDFFTMVRGDD